MAKPEVEQQSSHRRQNRFLVMLLVCAALISAARDVGRLRDLTGGLAGLVASVHGTIRSDTPPAVEPNCPQAVAENDRSGQPYNWSGRVAPDQLSEMTNSNGGIDAVPAIAGPELIVIRKTSDIAAPIVSAEIASQVPRVTNLARHAGGASNERIAVKPVRYHFANESATIRLRDHGLQLNVGGRAVSEVVFVRHLINGEIRAATLNVKKSSRVCPATPRVDSHLLNGRLKIAAAFAQPKLQTEIPGREDNATLAGGYGRRVVILKSTESMTSFDLLQILRASLSSEGLNDETVLDPLMLRDLMQRKMSVTPVAAENAQ